MPCLHFLAFCQSPGAWGLPQIKNLHSTKRSYFGKSFPSWLKQKSTNSSFSYPKLEYTLIFQHWQRPLGLRVESDQKLAWNKNLIFWQGLSELCNAKLANSSFAFSALEFARSFLSYFRTPGASGWPQVKKMH